MYIYVDFCIEFMIRIKNKNKINYYIMQSQLEVLGWIIEVNFGLLDFLEYYSYLKIKEFMERW